MGVSIFIIVVVVAVLSVLAVAFLALRSGTRRAVRDEPASDDARPVHHAVEDDTDARFFAAGDDRPRAPSRR